MNASEVLKGFAMKQVYGYLDKDPDIVLLRSRSLPKSAIRSRDVALMQIPAPLQ